MITLVLAHVAAMALIMIVINEVCDRRWWGPRFRVGDHVTMIDAPSEGVGVVRRVDRDGSLWVETDFNMWRNSSPEWFARTAAPLPSWWGWWRR